MTTRSRRGQSLTDPGGLVLGTGRLAAGRPVLAGYADGPCI